MSSPDGGMKFVSQNDLIHFYNSWKENYQKGFQEDAAIRKLKPQQREFLKDVIAGIKSKEYLVEVQQNFDFKKMAKSIVPLFEYVDVENIGVGNPELKDSLAERIDDTAKRIFRAENLAMKSSVKEDSSIHKAEVILNGLYERAPLLKQMEGEAFVEGLLNEIKNVSVGTPGEKFQPISDFVWRKLKDWAEKNSKDPATAHFMKNIVDEMKNEHQQMVKAAGQEGIFDDENIKEAIRNFRERFHTSYAARKLSPADKKALSEAGLKGINQAEVVFDSLKAITYEPLKKALIALHPANVAKAVSSTPAAVKEAVQGLPANVRSFFTKVWNVISGNSETLSYAETQQVVKKLRRELDAEREQLEPLMNALIEGKIGDKEIEALDKRVETYYTKVELLVRTLKVMENYLEDKYILLPHLATRHGIDLKDQASVLSHHLLTALDMKHLLSMVSANTSSSKVALDILKAEIAKDGLVPINAFKSLVKTDRLKPPMGHLEVEREAAELYKRAIHWLQYAKETGGDNGLASLHLADIIARYDYNVWTPANADETFSRLRTLYADAQKSWDPAIRKAVVVGQAKLLWFRYLASTYNKEPAELQKTWGLAAVESFTILRDSNSLMLMARQSALDSERVSDKATALAQQEISKKASEVILGSIESRLVKNNATANDISLLTSLAAIKNPTAIDYLKNREMVQAFFNKVEENRNKKKVTLEQFNAITYLVGHSKTFQKAWGDELTKKIKAELEVLSKVSTYALENLKNDTEEYALFMTRASKALLFMNTMLEGNVTDLETHVRTNPIYAIPTRPDIEGQVREGLIQLYRTHIDAGVTPVEDETLSRNRSEGTESTQPDWTTAAAESPQAPFISTAGNARLGLPEVFFTKFFQPLKEFIADKLGWTEQKVTQELAEKANQSVLTAEGKQTLAILAFVDENGNYSSSSVQDKIVLPNDLTEDVLQSILDKSEPKERIKELLAAINYLYSDEELQHKFVYVLDKIDKWIEEQKVSKRPFEKEVIEAKIPDLLASVFGAYLFGNEKIVANTDVTNDKLAEFVITYRKWFFQMSKH